KVHVKLLQVLFILSVSTFPSTATKTALLNVDIQNCFVTNGTLPVPDGETIVPIINIILQGQQDKFDVIFNTQDWHPYDHISFASQHLGHDVYDVIDLKYNPHGDLCSTSTVNTSYSTKCSVVAHNVSQTLWPDHCVINTTDADFVSTLLTTDKTFIIQKGYNRKIDSYSAFYDNGGFTQTELHNRLKSFDIDTLFITGLATDFCLYWTAKDAKRLGYNVYVVLDTSRGITFQGTIDAVADMRTKGIHIINSTDVASALEDLNQSSYATTLPSNHILVPMVLVAFWTMLDSIVFE
ncbi:unnamed protein product, partial [Owenia fusiformis]